MPQSLIETNVIDGQRKVIDLSADAANSWNGPSVETTRAEALAAGEAAADHINARREIHPGRDCESPPAAAI